MHQNVTTASERKEGEDNSALVKQALDFLVLMSKFQQDLQRQVCQMAKTRLLLSSSTGNQGEG